MDSTVGGELNRELGELEGLRTLETPLLHWEVLDGDELSSEFIDLRRSVYHQESGLLGEDRLIDHNDHVGQHIVLRDPVSSAMIASVTVVDAESSDFGSHSGFAKESLHPYFFATRATVAPSHRGQGLFFVLMYMACRHYRMQGRSGFISYLELEPTIAARRFLPCVDMPAANRRRATAADGSSYELSAVSCEINETMAKTFARMPESMKAWVRKNLMAEEIDCAVKRGLSAFYATGFCKKVFDGSLTRQEYITTMANNHQFVRWTTRLVAKIVSDCSDAELRKHLFEHLSGEIDHEVWIENDLEHLGADVEFVKYEMVPNQYIHQFMCIQESTIHFTRDPIIFLSVPIAIEAVTAFMPQSFITSLKECIRSWGVTSPSKACTFLASHIHTDGGEQGHWQGTLEMIRKYIQNEHQLAWMLNVVNMIFDSVNRAYDSYVSLPPLDGHRVQPEASAPH